ncbi:hypothetical protein JBW_02169 [Pelosinus fermentans JBW45]|uniref:Uncharacterized protein n=2 Tax=Pelosinus TaxID=365348 RepID=I9NV49_9FIRM|nr:hypothetical protein JBW_02169 [Pelosinus fermentans JBW45]
MDKEQIIKLAAEAAVSAAMNYLAQQRLKEKKSRHDKRLRNTKLLLDNYSLLQDHCVQNVIMRVRKIGINAHGVIMISIMTVSVINVVMTLLILSLSGVLLGRFSLCKKRNHVLVETWFARRNGLAD